MKTMRSELTYFDPTINKNISSAETILSFVAEADPFIYFIGFYDDNDHVFKIMPYKMLKEPKAAASAWCEGLKGSISTLSEIEDSLNEQFNDDYGKIKLIEVFKDYMAFNWKHNRPTEN